MQTYELKPASTGRRSLDLLRQGSAEAFVDALCAEVYQHDAVEHAYLHQLASGDLPDMEWAIRDFCHQYYVYSASFTHYLEAVIERLPLPQHREILRQNLEEELGHDPANPEQIEHAELFQRFRRAAGVTPQYAARNAPCTTAVLWRDQFLQTCQSDEPGVGLGALGIATEMVVSRVYQHLHKAVTTYTRLTPDDALFLTLHMECDDEHADQMKAVSIDLAEDFRQREALRYGALASLGLRSAFWDAMLARAVTS